MIYGYARKKINEFGLLELTEVSFAESPETLRQIGRFLIEMADLIAMGEFEKHSHYHIETFVSGWRKLAPGRDIIVLPPEK